MGTVKIFIASSAELEEDRKNFREFLSVKNDLLSKKGVYLELVQWEYFLNSVSQTGKQDDYNAKLINCDVVICLFHTKAGKYTVEEFDTALEQFKKTGSPLIYTYFKEPETGGNPIPPTPDETINEADRKSLENFKKKLDGLKHFYTRYTGIDNLQNQFALQLDILESAGFEKLKEDFKTAVTNYNSLSIVGNNNVGIQGDNNQVNVTYVYNNNQEQNKKPTNYFLCRSLIESLQDYNTKAMNFLDVTVDEADKANWETQDNYLPKAKTIIVSSFSSILGSFLFKIMACESQQDYFELSLATTKRMLQLLCFAFISKYWDQPVENKQQLTTEMLRSFKKFFYAGVEQNITFYADFLKSLAILFQDQPLLVHPIPEMKNLSNDFKGESVFLNACKTFDAFRAQFGKDQSMPPIDEIEKHLTSVVVSLTFLAKYKMISIKNIGYEAVRTSKAQFIHAYTSLGVNSGEIYKFNDNPINTDAVLLYKDKYKDGINLFPFIIDINALRDQNLAKICFYACYDENDKMLTYYDTFKISSKDNSSDVIIEFNKEFEDIKNDLMIINKGEDRDITDFKKDQGVKYRTMKMFELYTTFEKAGESFIPKEDE